MMTPAALTLLLSAADPAPSVLAALPASECPARAPDASVGGRAVIADDGTSIVVQCGDGSIKAWRADAPGFVTIGRMPLFRAARDRGIVPATIACPGPALSGDQAKEEADCDVLDHSASGDAYLLRHPSGLDVSIVSAGGAIRETSLTQQFGAILPGARGEDVYFVEHEKRPERLQRQPLRGGRIDTVAKLPNPSLLFEDGEGFAGEMGYSDAHRLIIVSFGGAFRVASEMTYLRAFDAGGRERWQVRAALPPRDDNAIVGDFTRLLVMDDGRFGLFVKTSDRSTTQVLDLGSGHTVATMSGWPIAAARKAPIAWISDGKGGYSLVRVPLTIPADR